MRNPEALLTTVDPAAIPTLAWALTAFSLIVIAIVTGTPIAPRTSMIPLGSYASFLMAWAGALTAFSLIVIAIVVVTVVVGRSSRRPK